MRRFSLFRRGQVWYVRLHNPMTNRYTTARSTGEFQKNAALLVVAERIRDGVEAREGPPVLPDLVDSLLLLFDFEFPNLECFVLQ